MPMFMCIWHILMYLVNLFHFTSASFFRYITILCGFGTLEFPMLLNENGTLCKVIFDVDIAFDGL